MIANRPIWLPRVSNNLSPQPTNASYTFEPINCGQFVCARFQLTAASTGTPVFTFKLQGSESPFVETDMNSGGSSAQWTDMILPAGAVHFASSGSGVTFSGPSVTIGWDGTAPLNCMIDVSNMPTWLRLVATNTSGGSGTASMYAAFGARAQGG